MGNELRELRQLFTAQLFHSFFYFDQTHIEGLAVAGTHNRVLSSLSALFLNPSVYGFVR